jgi:hypothetical protein
MSRSRRVGMLIAVGLSALCAAGTAFADHHDAGATKSSPLPVKAIESALQAKGTVSNGVLSVGLDRDDIGTVKLHGTPIKPSFELNGELDFQRLDGHQAFFNGDLALKPSEIDPVIDAIARNGLTFQAEHQHMYDFRPMVWFIHLRGTGDPVKLAQAVHNVVKATSTPLPQAPPPHPKTPLDTQRLQKILRGSDAEVGSDGVVTVSVPRRNGETIGGVSAKPEANISNTIAFEPLNANGSRVAAIPDFALEAGEIGQVVGTMRDQGWDIGCLYNQETDERPQLYFSHQFKTGDPYELAAEIRKGLDRSNAQ